MTWNEALHRRDAEGQFTHASVSAWAAAVSSRIGHDLARALRGVEHPPGHAEAKRRARELWNVPALPGRTERTDAEQDELDALEQAFDTYRQHLGLHHHSGLMYRDDQNGRYGEHGEYLGEHVTEDRPLAARLGYRRVGEHPRGAGRVGGEKTYWNPSIHPDAGGLWINPARPGTRHEPSYVNDMGHGVAALRKPESRSRRSKGHIQGLRRGEYRSSPDDADRGHRRAKVDADWREGRFGYGVHADVHDDEGLKRATAFVGAMKRVRARGSQENARTPVRRTPRGTQIESWMDQASAQLARRSGRG